VAARDATILTTEIAGLPREAGGGLRDVYSLDHEQLIFHLDRVAARGLTLPTAVPGTGRVTAQLSAFWFAQTHNIAPSHFLTDDPEAIRRRLTALGTTVEPELLVGRAQLVNRTRPIPVVCDVIGALFDSDWEEYRTTGSLAGRNLPPGLSEGDRLPEPLFVPRGADEAPLSEHALSHMLEPGYVRQIEARSRALYAVAAELAGESAGLFLTRARFQFGLLAATLVLIGCPLTPESASFREADSSPIAAAHVDLARGAVEEYLRRIHWLEVPASSLSNAHAPELPPDVATATASRYRDLFERLTGQELA
jgi:phosphoribosylaminoimidazole-succinocarboxamide synthase